MKHAKLVIKAIKKDKNGQMRIVTAHAPNAVCRDCKEAPRRNGSAVCEECARRFKVLNYENERLARRVEGAKEEARKEN